MGHAGQESASTASDDLSHLRWGWLHSRGHMNLIVLREEWWRQIICSDRPKATVKPLRGTGTGLQHGAEDSLSPPVVFVPEHG